MRWPSLGAGQDKSYLRSARGLDDLLREIEDLPNTDRWKLKVVIDKVDDDWDGANVSVLALMAMMHACVELRAILKNVRPLLFILENIFERVRRVDNEFPRLETSIASLDWTKELLIDFVAKRFHQALNPKPPLAQVWEAFFEHRRSSELYVLIKSQ